MSWNQFWCKHDWVLIRCPKLASRWRNHEIFYEGTKVYKCEFVLDANFFLIKHSDYICSMCQKLNLNMHKLKTFVDEIEKLTKAEEEKTEARIEAKKLGLKLVRMADKARR